jgi:DNA-binding NarL/FixJ family response regulator
MRHVHKGLCYILESHVGVEVGDEATNGREAVQKAIELRPDLVILDVTMPELDGLSAARQIKTALPDVPILILSMPTGSGMIKQAQRAGAQGFVTRPKRTRYCWKQWTPCFGVRTFFRNNSFGLEYQRRGAFLATRKT